MHVAVDQLILFMMVELGKW